MKTYNKFDKNIILLLGLFIIFSITFVLPNLNIKVLNLLTRPIPLIILFLVTLYIAEMSLPIGVLFIIAITILTHFRNQKSLHIYGYQNSIENFIGGYPLESSGKMTKSHFSNQIQTYNARLYKHGKVCDISSEDIDSVTILKPDDNIENIEDIESVEDVDSNIIDKTNSLTPENIVSLEVEKITTEYKQPLSDINLIGKSTDAVIPDVFLPKNNDTGITGFNYNSYGDLGVNNYSS